MPEKVGDITKAGQMKEKPTESSLLRHDLYGTKPLPTVNRSLQIYLMKYL
jgi:hypothetical protein